MSETVTLYRISFFDMIMIIMTRGLWLLFVMWSNEVKVSAEAIEQGEA